jgi:hypothetical protein
MTNNCKFVKTLEFMRNRKNHLIEKLDKNKTEKILISKEDAVLLSSAKDASSKAMRSIREKIRGSLRFLSSVEG